MIKFHIDTLVNLNVYCMGILKANESNRNNNKYVYGYILKAKENKRSNTNTSSFKLESSVHMPSATLIILECISKLHIKTLCWKQKCCVVDRLFT